MTKRGELILFEKFAEFKAWIKIIKNLIFNNEENLKKTSKYKT
jgi:hypothetical protein